MKIGVIGAGQIGSRHIQGALKVREHDLEIDVVEPNQDATILSKKRNEEIESEHTVNYHQNIQGLEGKYEVIIVSTNSTNRLEITTDLLNRVDVKVLILEKVVFQSIEEFTILKENLKDRNTLVYVNHPRRMYSYYQDLKNELKQTKQTISHIHVLGNEWGLACNGLHFIDLASFLMDKNPISISNNHLEDIRPSKRLGYIEFTGHLWVHFEQRSTLLLSSLIGNNRSTSIEIICADHKYHIEEGGRGIISLFKNSKWISDTPITTPFQSELTNYLIEDILNGKTPKITPIQLSETCHQSFIESLKDFTFKHSGEDYKRLPIT